MITDETQQRGMLKSSAISNIYGNGYEWLGPSQDVHFFYTCSHSSTLQNYELISSTNFQFIFNLKNELHNLVIELCSAPFFQKYCTGIY